MKFERLSHITEEHIDQKVKLQGWLSSIPRKQGDTLLFLDLNDGTLFKAPVRAVATKEAYVSTVDDALTFDQ